MGRNADQPGLQWNHALAGTTAGLCTQLTLHPLDVVKTRLQVQDGAGLLPAYRGTLDALQQIVRQEGWRALYSGLTPALAGSGLAWGIYFYSYNRAKTRYARGTGGAKLSPGMHLLSAAEAGALVCFITNPIWVVKTRLQLQRRTLQQVTAKAAAAASAAAGAAAPAVADAAASAAAAGTAAAAAALRAGLHQQAASGAAGGSSGAAAAAGKLRLPQFLAGRAAPEACAIEYRGFLHAFVQIARCEGLPGLYKGLLPSLLLVSHGAIQFAVYEELKAAAQTLPSLQRFTSSLDGAASGSSSDHRNRSTSGSNSSSSIGSRSSSRHGSEQSSSSSGSSKAAAARELSSLEITACGALSKLVASLATYPSQVVRSRLQQRMDSRALRYSGVGDVVAKTLQREGVGGFYKGLAPHVLRVMPQSALTFLVYEQVMRLLDDRSAARAAAT